MSLVKFLACLGLAAYTATLSSAFSSQTIYSQKIRWGGTLQSRSIAMSTVTSSESSEVIEEISSEGVSNEDQEEDEADVLMDFVAMVEETTPGELGDDELSLIPNVMEEFSTLPGPEAAQIVEKLLFRMVDEWEVALDKGDTEIAEILQPKASGFQTAMNTWMLSGSRDASKRVGFLYQELEAVYKNGAETAKPNLGNVKTALKNLAYSKDKGNDRKAWSIFQRMEEYGLQPDGDCYTAIIKILAKDRHRGAAGRAEKVLREAVEKCPPDGTPNGISVDAFNAIITAWAKSNFEDGPKRAEALIVLMDEVNRSNGGDYLKPNVQSFTSLIDAYAQTNEWERVRDSEGILNRLLDQFLDGEEELEPNLATWTIVMSAYMRLSRKRSRGAADRAERLLRRIEELSSEGRTSYAPDIVAYNTVLNAWAASISEGAAQRAENILRETLELYLDGDDSMKPTTKSFKQVIGAWVNSKTPDAMQKAEALLDLLEDHHADVIDDQVIDTYKSVLFGWSKRNEPFRAQEYLEIMVSEGMKPDSFCFDKVIEAYNLKNDKYSLPKTMEVFELMETVRQAGDVKPNERVYTSFIRALVKGRVKGMAKKASITLKRMEGLYEEGNRGIKPTVFTYNAALNACAESVEEDPEQRLEAFKMAIGIFKTLQNLKNEGPDHVTFGNMLRCAALLPEGDKRNSVVTTTFKIACDNGFVNTYVIRDIKYAAPERLWRSLLSCPSGEPDVEDLPRQWRTRFENSKKK